MAGKAKKSTQILHSRLRSIARGHGFKLDALRQAAKVADELQAKLKKFVVQAVPLSECPETDVIFTGSLGRREITNDSDADFLILVDGIPDPSAIMRLVAEVETICRDLGLKEPGSQGTFGDFTMAAELMVRIGLQADSNANTTRRLGLLTESISVYNPRIRREVVGKIHDRYCVDYQPNNRRYTGPIRAPRFLINDVSRYWRMMAVDFGAKQWRATSNDWGVRYAKLVTSRKILFAGSLMPLLLTETALHSAGHSAGAQHKALRAYLGTEFELPPLVRLMRAYQHLQTAGKNALADILEAYEAFIELMNERGSRGKMQKDFQDTPEGKQVKKLENKIQKGLQTAFFNDPLLRPLTQKYGVF